MQAVQPYRPGKYAPAGPRWAQYGDSNLENASAEAHKSLSQKRLGMDPFHLEKLRRTGFFPLQYSPPVHHGRMAEDIPTQAIEAYDRMPMPQRPAHLPSPHEDFHDASEGTMATISPPGTPRDEWGRVRRAGFEVAGHVARGAGNVAMKSRTALEHNIADTVPYAQLGGEAVGHVGRALQNRSKRALSAGASHAVSALEGVSSAMEPGSNTRQALADVATGASGMVGSAAAGAREVLAAAGPPLIAGGYAAAHLGGHAAVGLGKGIGHTARGVGHVVSAAADLAVNHVIPAAHTMASHSMSLASRVFDAATLSSKDIIEALGEMQQQEHYSAHSALENGHHGALGNGYAPARRRGNTPPRKRNTHGVSAAASAAPRQEHSYTSAREWLEYSHNRGVLIEELYKRPNWTHFIREAGQKNELRKKLLSMNAMDLADILVRLDHM